VPRAKAIRHPVPKRRPSQRSVAVTGASGVLGRALLRRLESNPEVGQIVAFHRQALSGGPYHKTRAVEIDLARPAAEAEISMELEKAQVDTLVHLALLYNPQENAAYAHEVEVIGTLQLLGAAAAANVRALVLMSSTALYGPNPDNPAFLSEHHPLRPNPDSRFLADKIEVERQAEAFREASPARKVCILRLASLLGPDVVNPATRLLRRPVIPVLLGFDPLFQFLHLEDAALALERAVLLRPDEVLNVAAPEPLALSEVLRMLRRAPLPLPPALARSAMVALWSVLGLGTPPGWLDYLRYSWVADGRRAEEVLGFNYKFSSGEALADFGRSIVGARVASVMTVEA
jgi:UDP-glucose 4-epimerase